MENQQGNHQSTHIEKTRLKDKFRDTMMLFAFVVISALGAVAVMDLTVLPLSVFAVSRPELFTFILRDLIWLFLAALLLAMLVRYIILLRKNGLSTGEILRRIFFRPVSALTTAMMILTAAFVLIGIIYLLFSYNNYYIYKLIN